MEGGRFEQVDQPVAQHRQIPFFFNGSQLRNVSWNILNLIDQRCIAAHACVSNGLHTASLHDAPWSCETLLKVLEIDHMRDKCISHNI